MNVVGFCGYSGSGKTTLVEQLVARLRFAGHRVSVVKHAHHHFDIDQPGKDSHRHRAAGAYEVVIASNRRLAKIREYEVEADPNAHQLIAELSAADWVLVEGFKHADLLKIEIWRAATGQRRGQVALERVRMIAGAQRFRERHDPYSRTIPFHYIGETECDRLFFFLLTGHGRRCDEGDSRGLEIAFIQRNPIFLKRGVNLRTEAAGKHQHQSARETSWCQ